MKDLSNDISRFEDLPVKDQIDYFISRISGDEKGTEIHFILALHTAYNMSIKLYSKYFSGLDTIETTDKICEYLLGDYEEEDIAWQVIFDNLGTNKILDIIEHIDDYMDRYNKIKAPLEELRDQIYSLFTKL